MTYQLLRRERGGVTEYDSDTGLSRYSGQVGRANKQSSPESGVYDAPIDLTLNRVDTLPLNGYRMQVADFHYAIQTEVATGDQYPIGTMGFGGRQGNEWVLSRYAGLIWFNPTTRARQVIATPTYDPANISRVTSAATIAGEDYNLSTVGTWADLMTTPNGGSVSMRLVLRPWGLKWDITVDQLAREYYQANNPPPNNNWYLTCAFDVDLAGNTDFPRAARLFRGQDFIDLDAVDLDVDDDTGRFEWRNAADQFLAFMPADSIRIGQLYPGPATAGMSPREWFDAGNTLVLPLRKRLYRDGGNVWMLVGIQASDLAGTPDGILRFDPSWNIAETAEDCCWWDGDDEYTTPDELDFGTDGLVLGQDGDLFDAAWIWRSTAIPQGATITAASFTLTDAAGEGAGGTVNFTLGCLDATTLVDFLNADGHTNVESHHPLTTATTVDTASDTGNYTSASLVDEVQEVVNEGAFNGDVGIGAQATTGGRLYWDDYSSPSATVAELTVTYTAAGVEATLQDTFTFSENQLRDGWFVR